MRIESIYYRSGRDVTYHSGVADGRGTLHRQFVMLLKDCSHSAFDFVGFQRWRTHVLHEYAFDCRAARLIGSPV